MTRRATYFLLLICLFLAPARLSFAAPTLTIEQEGVNEIINLSVGPIEANKTFFLDDPDRLVVDLPLASVPKLSLPQDYQGSLINKVRAGRFNAETVRIVFDLTSAATQVSKSYDDNVLMITLAGKEGKTSKKTWEKPAEKKIEKPLVFIDPGHGGDDPGAIGPKGSQEKDIVLTFAKALQESLLRTGKYRVQLSRESDKFIVLRDRVKQARAAKASIFLSIHADSAPNNMARGLSVYTLSEKASDAEAEALAQRENKVDILGGMDLSNEREDVADILISLAQRETRGNSAMLADILTASLSKKVKLLPNAHRFAGFAVLKAPDIPSVLIETGFISHPSEEKLLKTKEYRQKLIAGITDGVNSYFAKQVMP